MSDNQQPLSQKKLNGSLLILRIFLYLCIKNSLKMTKEEFIDKAREIHEIEYDYSLTPSIMRTHEQVEIVCPIHGKFIQEVRGHLKGQNCPQCARLIYAQKRKYTNEEFIRRANIKHNFFL